MRVERVPLKRNGTGYLIENFVFTRSYQERKRIFLKCQNKRSGCTARASIAAFGNYDDLRVTNPHHNHDIPSSTAMVFRNRLIAEVKKPSNARASLSQVYSHARNVLLEPLTNLAEREGNFWKNSLGILQFNLPFRNLELTFYQERHWHWLHSSSFQNCRRREFFAAWHRAGGL